MSLLAHMSMLFIFVIFSAQKAALIFGLNYHVTRVSLEAYADCDLP